MAVITPDKTPDITVMAHAEAAHPITVVGPKISVLTERSIVLFLYHGYVEATADTNPGKFKVQTRPDAGGGSVNEHWKTIIELPVKGTTPDTEAMTATEGVGVTSLAVASTTGFVAEDLLYIQDTGTFADSEWAECQEIVTNTSIELIDGLTNEKDSSDVIFNDASVFVFSFDLSALEAYRVIWSHEGATGADGHIKVLASTHDSDTST